MKKPTSPPPMSISNGGRALGGDEGIPLGTPRLQRWEFYLLIAAPGILGIGTFIGSWLAHQ